MGTLIQWVWFVKSSARLKLKTSQWREATLRGIAVFLAVVAGTACSEPSAPTGKALYQLPWPTSSGAYALQNVEIKTLNQPTTLEGAIARILIDPFKLNGSLNGKTVARFAQTSDNVFIPTDYATLQATAVYAHHERLYELDTEVGVAGLLNWPLTIAVHANVLDGGGVMANNALYDGQLDALLIVPYSAKRMPISLNAGILAHEHFHKIFQTMVIKKVRQAKSARPVVAGAFATDCHGATIEDLPPAPALSLIDDLDEEGADAGDDSQNPTSKLSKPIYNEFLLRALNEGLADFWGWVYSGDNSYFGRSLSDLENDRRRLDQDPSPMPSPDIWRYQLLRFEREIQKPKERDLVRIRLAYELGTYYSRFFRTLALKISGGKDTELEARLPLAKAIMAALPDIGTNLAAKAADNEFASPNAVLRLIYKRLPKVSEGECAMYEKFAAPEAKPVKPAACRPPKTQTGPM